MLDELFLVIVLLVTFLDTNVAKHSSICSSWSCVSNYKISLDYLSLSVKCLLKVHFDVVELLLI